MVGANRRRNVCFLSCRVDESRDHDGVDDVGDEVAPLGQGARDQRGRRRGEHELEEPLGQHVGCNGEENVAR